MSFGKGEVNVKYNNDITRLEIEKLDKKDNKPLENVYFDLLDSNKNIVFKDLVTNKNGKIILENLLPGKYFLKETKTVENYTLYSKLIDIDLKLNQEFKVNVKNIQKEEESHEKDEKLIEVEESNSKFSKKENYEKEKLVLEKESIEIKEKMSQKSTLLKLPKTGM